MPRALPSGFAALLIALLPLGLGGCLFEQPLTAPSNLTSPNIDSRLLGVFEMTEKGKKPGDPDVIHRAAVLPGAHEPSLIGGGANTYLIYYRDFSKKPARTLRFKAWLSRVDNATYLSFEDLNEGTPTAGRFGFFRYEWEFPGNFLLFAPDLPEAAEATSPFRVRQALRAKLKANAAFPFQATFWKKIARIWWDPKNPDPITTVPPEFEQGTKLDKPSL